MRQRAMEGKREREGRESIRERKKEGGMGEQEREEEREIKRKREEGGREG